MHDLADRPLAPKAAAAAASLRVAVVADYAEERWPSMDLVASMLMQYLSACNSAGIRAVKLQPAMVSRLSKVPTLREFARADIADRIVNRFWDYPRWLAPKRDAFDIFHIVDHSYAHLVHVLPPERTVVTCHDTDAFLSLVEPGRDRSDLPKMFARRIYDGLRKAARIVCPSAATRDELHRYGIVSLERTIVVPNGVHSGFSHRRDAVADSAVEDIVGSAGGSHIDLLHVGSTIPRKRIDLLLRVVAAVKERAPRVRLIKVGGAFTDDQQQMIRSLGLESNILSLPFFDCARLAALYRHAAMVLVTSEREGFGLPVVEAMACGTPVVATELPVLREVGGTAAAYCELDDVPAWRDTILNILEMLGDECERDLCRERCLVRAATFSWEHYATAMAQTYHAVDTISRLHS